MVVLLRLQEDGGCISETCRTMCGTNLAARAARSGRSIQEIELWPYEVLGDRVWALTGSLSACDTAYVALAERLEVPW